MLMRLITAVAIILALLSTTTLATQIFKFQQGVNNGYGVYEGGHDLTIIRPGYVSRPDTYLRIETEYPTGREVYNTLIRFDNLEDQLAGKQVLEASITLTYYDDGMPQPWVEAVVHTHPSLKPWSEVNADWNNYDTGLIWEQPGERQCDECSPAALGCGPRRHAVQTQPRAAGPHE